MPPEHLEIMTRTIDRAIVQRDQYVSEQSNNLTLKNEHDGFTACSADGKYFFFMYEDKEPEIKKIIFSTYIEEIVRGIGSAYAGHDEK